jgi:hypothetical protein
VIRIERGWGGDLSVQCPEWRRIKGNFEGVVESCWDLKIVEAEDLEIFLIWRVIETF